MLTGAESFHGKAGFRAASRSWLSAGGVAARVGGSYHTDTTDSYGMYGGRGLTLRHNYFSNFFFSFFYFLPHLSIYSMPVGPPSKGLNDFKDEILDRLHVRKWKQPEVVDWLADNHDIKINIRTLQRYLKNWDALQQDRTIDTEDLRKQIHFLFCR